MTELLRLRRSAEPLWRDVASLQFGLGRAAPRWLDPTPAELRLIDALVNGFPAAALTSVAGSAGLSVERAEVLIDAVRPVLVRPDPTVTVVVRPLADDVPPDLLDVVIDALRSRGCAATIDRASPSDVSDAPPDVTVLVIGNVCTPRDAAPWLRDDATHLPFVLRPDEVTIGPLVVPGVTACLSCSAARSKERDPAWPNVMSQLVGHPTPAVPVSLVAEAGALAATIIADITSLRSLPTTGDPRRSAAATRSVTVSLDAPRHWRSHRPHDACTCLGLEHRAVDVGESDSAVVSAVASA